MNIERTVLVDDIMRSCPATIRAFLDRRMNCPGCPIACFHTVEDGCLEHGGDAVLGELGHSAQPSGTG